MLTLFKGHRRNARNSNKAGCISIHQDLITRAKISLLTTVVLKKLLKAFEGTLDLELSRMRCLLVLRSFANPKGTKLNPINHIKSLLLRQENYLELSRMRCLTDYQSRSGQGDSSSIIS